MMVYVMSQVNGMNIGLDEDTLSKILGIPTAGVTTIRSGEGST